MAEIGSGVSNVGMGMPSCGSGSKRGVGSGCGRALSAPSRCRSGRARPPRCRGRRSSVAERRGGGADEPGVDRQPLAGRGLLDAGLELLGQAEVDARVAASSASGGARRRGLPRRLGRLVGRRRRDDEAGLAAAQAQLDRAGRELAGDLVGGGRQRVEQRQPDRRLERRRSAARPARGRPRRLRRRRRRARAEVLDVRASGPWRHYGTIMVPCQHHDGVIVARSLDAVS